MAVGRVRRAYDRAACGRRFQFARPQNRNALRHVRSDDFRQIVVSVHQTPKFRRLERRQARRLRGLDARDCRRAQQQWNFPERIAGKIGDQHRVDASDTFADLEFARNHRIEACGFAFAKKPFFGFEANVGASRGDLREFAVVDRLKRDDGSKIVLGDHESGLPRMGTASPPSATKDLGTCSSSRQ